MSKTTGFLVCLLGLSACGGPETDVAPSSVQHSSSLNERAFIIGADGQPVIHSAGCFALPADAEDVGPTDISTSGTANPALGDLQQSMRIGNNGAALTVFLGGRAAVTKFYGEDFIASGKVDEFDVTGAQSYRLVYWGGKCSNDFTYPIKPVL